MNKKDSFVSPLTILACLSVSIYPVCYSLFIAGKTESLRNPAGLLQTLPLMLSWLRDIGWAACLSILVLRALLKPRYSSLCERHVVDFVVVVLYHGLCVAAFIFILLHLPMS